MRLCAFVRWIREVSSILDDTHTHVHTHMYTHAQLQGESNFTPVGEDPSGNPDVLTMDQLDRLMSRVRT